MVVIGDLKRSCVLNLPAHNKQERVWTRDVALQFAHSAVLVWKPATSINSVEITVMLGVLSSGQSRSHHWCATFSMLQKVAHKIERSTIRRPAKALAQLLAAQIYVISK